jgi:hypothetical protein
MNCLAKSALMQRIASLPIHIPVNELLTIALGLLYAGCAVCVAGIVALAVSIIRHRDDAGPAVQCPVCAAPPDEVCQPHCQGRVVAP